MMYQFVHELATWHTSSSSPQDMTLEPVLIFLYPLLEQMLTTALLFLYLE